MSSILKALKKLEDEKTSHSPDSLKIDSDILKGSQDSRRMSPFLALLAFLLMFGGGAGAAYFIMKGNVTQPVAVPQAVPVATTKPPTAVIPQAAKPVQPVAKAVTTPAQKKTTTVVAVQNRSLKRLLPSLPRTPP